MEKIILETDNIRDSEKIISLANRLGITISKESKIKQTKKSSSKAIDYLKQIAERGKVAKLIKNPVKWQKEARIDKKLLYR